MKSSGMILLLLGRRSSSFTTSPSSASRSPLVRNWIARSMTTVDESSTVKAPKETDTNTNTTPLPDMEEIVSLCKRRGIIFPSSDIYNGMAGFYDYGPLGVELKKNVKDAWWRHFVTQREDVVGLDSSIIHNPKTWKSSGTLRYVMLCYVTLRNPLFSLNLTSFLLNCHLSVRIIPYPIIY
jgi:hypothetical protein